MLVEVYGASKERLMVSESGAYALLIYHYCPENRLLREWLTHQVVPALCDAQPSRIVERPTSSVLDWPKISLCMILSTGASRGGGGPHGLCAVTDYSLQTNP